MFKYGSLLFIAFLLINNAYAAEFLIYNRTRTDVVQGEEASAYTIGDIVQVFPDGKLSDYATAGGKLLLVRVVGLSYEAALKYQQQDDEIINGELKMRSRRVYRIRLEDLPNQVKNALKNTYVYNTTWIAVKNYINNKVTNANE